MLQGLLLQDEYLIAENRILRSALEHVALSAKPETILGGIAS
jgi:hypothetical protein